jgi:hypothetical protein
MISTIWARHHRATKALAIVTSAKWIASASLMTPRPHLGQRPTIRAGILVEPSLHPIEAVAETRAIKTAGRFPSRQDIINYK